MTMRVREVLAVLGLVTLAVCFQAEASTREPTCTDQGITDSDSCADICSSCACTYDSEDNACMCTDGSGGFPVSCTDAGEPGAGEVDGPDEGGATPLDSEAHVRMLLAALFGPGCEDVVNEAITGEVLECMWPAIAELAVIGQGGVSEVLEADREKLCTSRCVAAWMASAHALLDTSGCLKPSDVNDESFTDLNLMLDNLVFAPTMYGELSVVCARPHSGNGDARCGDLLDIVETRHMEPEAITEDECTAVGERPGCLALLLASLGTEADPFRGMVPVSDPRELWDALYATCEDVHGLPDIWDGALPFAAPDDFRGCTGRGDQTYSNPFEGSAWTSPEASSATEQAEVSTEPDQPSTEQLSTMEVNATMIDDFNATSTKQPSTTQPNATMIDDLNATSTNQPSTTQPNATEQLPTMEVNATMIDDPNATSTKQPSTPGYSGKTNKTLDCFDGASRREIANLGVYEVGSVVNAGCPEFRALERVTGNVEVLDSSTELRFGNITQVGGNVNGSPGALQAVDFGKLTSVSGNLDFYNNDLTSVDFRDLESVGGYLSLGFNEQLTSVDIGDLESVGGYLSLEFNEQLTSVDFGNLTSVGGHLVLNDNGLTSVDCGGIGECVCTNAFVSTTNCPRCCSYCTC